MSCNEKIVSTLALTEQEMNRLSALSELYNTSRGALILERAFSITTAEYARADEARRASEEVRSRMRWLSRHNVTVSCTPGQAAELSQMASVMAAGSLTVFFKTVMYSLM